MRLNPAVQFSLLTLTYTAIFPIAIRIRASNTYEERTVGIWRSDGRLDESSSKSYVMEHIRNQLTFDILVSLWEDLGESGDQSCFRPTLPTFRRPSPPTTAQVTIRANIVQKLARYPSISAFT